MRTDSVLAERVETYLAPRTTVLREGAAAELGSVARDLGILQGRLLIVADPFLKDDASLARLQESFDPALVTTTVVFPPPGEPDLGALEEAVATAREIDATFVVGIGGGSAIDLAKAVAMMVANAGSFDDTVERIASGSAVGALPVIAVPTTAGTGAEATKIAVIKTGGKKKVLGHASMVPMAAVLDPDLLRTLPRSITAATGVDALSHAIESYLSTNASYLTRQASLRAMELVSHHLPRVADDPEDLRSRRGTMYGAYLAGLGLNAGVILGHSMAYSIANRTPLAHGVTCGMALPYALAYSARESAEDLRTVSEHLDGCAVGGADQVITWLQGLNERFDIPGSLSALGINAADAELMADECLELYPRPTNPRPLDSTSLRALFAELQAGTRPGTAFEGTHA